MAGVAGLTLKQRIGAWLIPRLPFSRFFFDLLRQEVNAWRVRLAWRLLPTRWLRLRKLRLLRGVYANVASAGYLLPGFSHLDLHAKSPHVIRWDCSRSLPYADGACKGIRVEQFFEHIEPREDLPRFIRDCYRALEPGGVLRIVVPDAERFLRAYCRDDDCGFVELNWAPPFPSDLPTRMDVVNHIFHQWHEHRWGYDFETLAHRLRTGGFHRIDKMAFRKSLDPVLGQDREQHAPYSLYVDAVK